MCIGIVKKISAYEKNICLGPKIHQITIKSPASGSLFCDNPCLLCPQKSVFTTKLLRWIIIYYYYIYYCGSGSFLGVDISWSTFIFRNPAPYSIATVNLEFLIWNIIEAFWKPIRNTKKRFKSFVIRAKEAALNSSILIRWTPT